MTANRIAILCLAVYGALFIITFGRAAANTVCDEKLWQPCPDQRVGAGLVSATFWPLYWSLVAFEKGADDDRA